MFAKYRRRKHKPSKPINVFPVLSSNEKQNLRTSQSAPVVYTTYKINSPVRKEKIKEKVKSKFMRRKRDQLHKLKSEHESKIARAIKQLRQRKETETHKHFDSNITEDVGQAEAVEKSAKKKTSNRGKRVDASTITIKKPLSNSADNLSNDDRFKPKRHRHSASQTSVDKLSHLPKKNDNPPKLKHQLVPKPSLEKLPLLPEEGEPSVKPKRKVLLPEESKSPSQQSRQVYEPLESSDDELYSIERKNSVQLPKLEPIEVEFLELVTENDVSGVKKFLEENHHLNINCINFQGVSALHTAVQNRSEEMVELLLRQPNIDIADTALYAVRDNNLKILVMLLDAQKKISPALEFAGATHSMEFPEHVTPLILAAQGSQYEAVSLLVGRGHTIPRPHPINCVCSDCKLSLARDDPLHASSARLAIYRAISSPVYLVQAASDPILAAFRLTVELGENANANRQLAADYLQLRDEVSAFPVDLIGSCRTSEEVEILLKQTSGSRGRRHFVLPRLLMAVAYKQKEFVAHPNTQQVLETYWMGDWYNWRGKHPLKKAGIMIMRILITPVILVMCIVAPRHRWVRQWQIPLNKLITHAAAYFLFLIIVFIISNKDKSITQHGPPNTGLEPFLVLYVFGYAWSTIRLCVMQGPRRYFSELWNWAEITMVTLYLLTFCLWIAAAVDARRSNDEDIERKYWSQYDPTLLSEGTYCLATIFAYFRLMFLCQLNYHLGPLQVSLGKMTIDIYKYIILFTIIISAFAAGLARFYQYYDGMVYEDEYGMKTVQVSSFTSLTDTLNTLFWALFCMAPLESADVVIENTRNDNVHDDKNATMEHENRHAFTERVGYFCFGAFEVISVIVVLNMLIATMSNTFQKVTDNVVTEWTFGRTEVYVDYISQTTLPSPYNLIPTASGICNIVEWFRTIIVRPPGAYARWSLSYCCYIERDVEANVEKEYPALISVLVQRYFRDKENANNGGSVESELEALRREFASLKTVVIQSINRRSSTDFEKSQLSIYS